MKGFKTWRRLLCLFFAEKISPLEFRKVSITVLEHAGFQVLNLSKNGKIHGRRAFDDSTKRRET